MKTLLIKEPSGQLMVTPQVFKVYSNSEYKVYKSTFECHFYVVIRKADGAIAMADEYNDVYSTFDFKYKLEGSF